MTVGIDTAHIVRTTTNDTRSFLFLTHTPRVVSPFGISCALYKPTGERTQPKKHQTCNTLSGEPGGRPYCRDYLARFATASSVAISATLRISLISSPEILPL